MPDRAPAWFTAASIALSAAAVAVTLWLWPDTSVLYDTADVGVSAAKAGAITAGGTLLVAACVCAVGALVAGRMRR
jgi:hypothetical protein